LKHYFLTYKDLPGQEKRVEITHTFGVEEAHEIISRAGDDYRRRFENLEMLLREV
jgi:inorganic pyrophosphatase